MWQGAAQALATVLLLAVNADVAAWVEATAVATNVQLSRQAFSCMSSKIAVGLRGNHGTSLVNL